MSYVLDTHAFVWWLGDVKKLSKTAFKLLDTATTQFYVPSIVLLEMQYLIEVDRIQTKISEAIAYVQSTANFSMLPFGDSVLIESLRITHSPDPFDRIIMATALAYNARLITKDTWMHEKFEKIVVW